MRGYAFLSLVLAGAATVSVVGWSTSRETRLSQTEPGRVRYTVTDLGAPPDSTSAPLAMNNAGEIVGVMTPPNRSSGEFLYAHGRFVDLTPTLGPGADLEGINSIGDVVGGMRLTGRSQFAQHAFLYSKGKVTDLGTLGGDSSLATGINDLSQVVGDAQVGGGAGLNAPWHAFLYSGGKIVDLGLPRGDGVARARGINASGDVVGFAFAHPMELPAHIHAVMWSHGRIEALGGARGAGCYAQAINGSGLAVGGTSVQEAAGGSLGHVVMFSGGKMRDLGTPGGSWAMPHSINAAGQVVGGARRSLGGGDPRGFLYAAGKMHDLDTLLAPSALHWHILAAFAINDRGQIACAAVNAHETRQRSVLLNPVEKGRTK